MTKVELKKKLMLEDYISFLENPDLPKLTMDQLNEIVTMHGFRRPRFKNETMEGLKSIPLRDPSRSTVGGSGEGYVYPCAPLDLEEVRSDIAFLGWEECPVGSLLAVGSSADAEERISSRNKKKKKERRVDDIPPTPLPISASSAMTSAAGSGGGQRKEKEKEKRKKRKRGRMPNALVVV